LKIRLIRHVVRCGSSFPEPSQHVHPAEKVPNLTLIIDHLAKPPIKDKQMGAGRIK
jgi:predicted TIM-barrel fold metal-dependent hydrolase